jgi:hypothetical protein
MAIVRMEELGKLKKIHLIGTRSRNLPACSTVPQPTMYELDRIWEESLIAYLNVVTRHPSG